MTKFKTVLASFALAISGAAAAQGLLGPSSNEDQFLHVDKAFVFGASADGGDRLRLDWQIAPGYYLYRHRVSVKTATAGFTLGALAMPDGKKKTDEFFGDVEVYYDFLSATVPVARLAKRQHAHRDHGQLPGLRRCGPLLPAGHEDGRGAAAGGRHPGAGRRSARRRDADGVGTGQPCGASLRAGASLQSS